MKLIIAALSLAMLWNLASAYISCSLCNGQYVHSNLGTGCVAAVREKCAVLKGRATTAWVRGINVKDNCLSTKTIPSGTAVATFHGTGATYNSGTYKHAAIFIGCEGNGFRVHDQWVKKDGSLYGCTARVLPFGSAGVDGGDNFWTIAD